MSLTFTPPATGTCKTIFIPPATGVWPFVIPSTFRWQKAHSGVLCTLLSHLIGWKSHVTMQNYLCGYGRILLWLSFIESGGTLCWSYFVPDTSVWSWNNRDLPTIHNNECVHNDCVLCILGQGSLTSWHYLQSWTILHSNYYCRSLIWEGVWNMHSGKPLNLNLICICNAWTI